MKIRIFFYICILFKIIGIIMKKITLLLLCLLVLANALYAQVAPDNEQILRGTIDSNSKFYYPSIHSRYMQGDTTLTLEDYHYLYYGYAYQDNYKPLESIPAETAVLAVLERGEQLDTLGAIELLRQAKMVMKSDPFSPKNINFMTYAYSVLGDEVSAKISADRFNKVLKTIEASGTGLREKSPMHLLWGSHGVDFIASKDLKMGKRRIVSRTVEYIALLEKFGDIKGYYFDFSRMYWKRPDSTPPKQKAKKWQFNGLNI